MFRRILAIFSFHSLPEFIQGRLHGLVVQTVQSLAAKNDDVQPGQILLQSEGFSDLAFNPVSLDSQSQIFLRENQTDPGVAQLVGRRQDQKIPVRNFQSYVIKDFAVIRRLQKPVRFRKPQSLHEVIPQLR